MALSISVSTIAVSMAVVIVVMAISMARSMAISYRIGMAFIAAVSSRDGVGVGGGWAPARGGRGVGCGRPLSNSGSSRLGQGRVPPRRAHVDEGPVPPHCHMGRRLRLDGRGGESDRDRGEEYHNAILQNQWQNQSQYQWQEQWQQWQYQWQNQNKNHSNNNSNNHSSSSSSNNNCSSK